MAETALERQFVARLRQLVLSLPLDNDHLQLRIAVAARVYAPRRLGPAVAWLPTAWLARRVNNGVLRESIRTVAQDVPIWEQDRVIPVADIEAEEA